MSNVEAIYIYYRQMYDVHTNSLQNEYCRLNVCLKDPIHVMVRNGHEAIVNAHLSATLTLPCDYQKRKFLGKFENSKRSNFHNHNDLSGTHSIMNF